MLYIGRRGRIEELEIRPAFIMPDGKVQGSLEFRLGPGHDKERSRIGQSERNNRCGRKHLGRSKGDIAGESDPCLGRNRSTSKEINYLRRGHISLRLKWR